MGAELGALGRVEAALEEGAEDGRLDRFPVELRRCRQGVNGFQRQVLNRNHIEERAIEVFDVFAEELAAAVHFVEEIMQMPLEDFRFAARLLDDIGEDAGGRIADSGQQADIFGEEAEDQLSQEEGDARGVGIPVAHIVGDDFKGCGRFFGDLLAVAAGVQALRIVKHGRSKASVSGLAISLWLKL